MISRHGSEFKPELYDEIEPGYYDHVFNQGKGLQWFWHHHRFGAVAEAIPATGESILDIGCGPGTFLGHFAGGYARGVGVDLAKAQIDFADKKYASGRLRFEAADVASLRGQNQFDTITSIEVIEHLPRGETHTFLKSLFSLLKDGGTLALTTPNYRSFWPLIEWVISKKGPVDYLSQHINRFDVERLTRELLAAGFTVEWTRTFYVISPFLAALSTRLADVVYRTEQRILPTFGSEIVIRAKKSNDR